MPRPLTATVTLVSALALAMSVAGCSGDAAQTAPPDPSGSSAAISPAPVASPADLPASWALSGDQSTAADRAGLSMTGKELLTVHYHAHLDLLIRGEPVVVPAGVGIDDADDLISPLHTHDTSGVIHIESDEDTPYTLGQFFTEWGQRLDSQRVGPVAMAADEQLRVYRDGKEVTGDPATITLTEHGEFFVWLGPAGTPPTKPPSKYTFPKGQ